MPTAERRASGGLQCCPRCGGKVAREGMEYICLICSTRFDLRPLRKEGRRYPPEERQRALALARRIGGIDSSGYFRTGNIRWVTPCSLSGEHLARRASRHPREGCHSCGPPCPPSWGWRGLSGCC